MASGVADVDALLGGLILGDNVVWVLDDAEVREDAAGALDGYHLLQSVFQLIDRGDVLHQIVGHGAHQIFG